MESIFEFDRKNLILRVSLQGQLTDPEMKECYTWTREIAERIRARSAILDLSGAAAGTLSVKALREISTTPPTLPDPFPRVIVAPKDLVYGLARMFQVFGEKTRHAMHVVHTLEEAYLIIGIASPHLEPLSDCVEAEWWRIWSRTA
jgi:hypothetical protein